MRLYNIYIYVYMYTYIHTHTRLGIEQYCQAGLRRTAPTESLSDAGVLLTLVNSVPWAVPQGTWSWRVFWPLWWNRAGVSTRPSLWSPPALFAVLRAFLLLLEASSWLLPFPGVLAGVLAPEEVPPCQ